MKLVTIQVVTEATPRRLLRRQTSGKCEHCCDLSVFNILGQRHSETAQHCTRKLLQLYYHHERFRMDRQCLSDNAVNPSTGTLKSQSNGPLYSDTVIGTLAVDGRAVRFGTAKRGLGGLRPRSVSSSLYQM